MPSSVLTNRSIFMNHGLEQIEACFFKCCDADNPANEVECAGFIQHYFPRNGSWVDRSIKFIYTNLGSYSRNLVFHHLNKTTRVMIEETAATGNVLLKDSLNRSLLIWALAYGFNDLAVSLVKRGADVNLRSVTVDGRPGDTPLSWAISTYTVDGEKPLSECRRLVDCLLAHGANIKALGAFNYSVTIQAISNVTGSSRDDAKNKEAGEFLIDLLEKGAPTEWKNSQGEVVYLLSVAIRVKMPLNVVWALANHGADPSKLTAEDQKKLKEILEEREAVETLEAKG